MNEIKISPSVNLRLSDSGIAQINLPATIKSEDELKSIFLAFASHIIDKKIKKVLLHNHELNHHISGQLQEWAHLSLELPLLQSGVEKIAIVHPKNKNVFNLIRKVDNARKRYFDTEAEAKAWLNS